MLKILESTSVIFIFIILISSCGAISLGPTGSPNDPVPSGSVLHQSTFTGLSGQTSVTGQEIFYNGTGVGNYILRLGDVNFPVESGLQVQVYSGTTLVKTFSLTASTGSQNYDLSGVGTQINFSVYSQISVYIYSTIKQVNYAVAN